MSVDQFCHSLPKLSFHKHDVVWFPRWIRRYAASIGRSNSEQLFVHEEALLSFLRTIRDRGVPAWQRLQAVRAIEAYRQHVLKIDQPSLVRFKQTLQRLAALQFRKTRRIRRTEDHILFDRSGGQRKCGAKNAKASAERTALPLPNCLRTRISIPGCWSSHCSQRQGR